MKKDVSLLDNFFIYSVDDLDKYKDRIIDICDRNNARATIRLNIRNAQKLSYQTMKIITDLMIQGDYKSVKSAYLSACGQFNSDKNKKWIIDLDGSDVDLRGKIINEINDIYQLNASYTTKSLDNRKIITEIKTKNGLHIICNPFDLNEFKKRIKSDIQIHKDQPTILYIP